MKLSIIIVNYNVKYFLQQLLLSIENSQVDFLYETIVIDNNSTDGSEELITSLHPDVRYHSNQENVGFARANNQGIRMAQGEFVLLLNPDTILQEATLQKTVAYLENHPKVGALGVRMIDGSGTYLPESKRGLPTPSVAFFKAFGLADLFPKSATFNRYYLGHLSEHEVNEIDVLTGAFFLVPKSVLNQVGLLDEHFFMYGEDIDLSYRIQMAGYQVIYLPTTSIIHFKGESTKKDSIAYIRSFYGAMILFAEKHYSGSRAQVLRIVLKTAIYLKAAWSIAKGIIGHIALPAFEGVVIFAVLDLFAAFWAQFYYADPGYYDQSLIRTNFMIYTGAWLGSLYLAGSYDEEYRWKRLFHGWISGWILIAVLYAFFDTMMRPSRVIVFTSGPLVLFLLFCSRSIWHRLTRGSWSFLRPVPTRFAVVGEQDEVKNILELMQSAVSKRIYVGQVSTQGTGTTEMLGHVDDLDQLAHFHNLDEIVFSAKSMHSSEIMRWMTELGSRYLYKIAPDRASTIIGSHSKNRPGEWFTFEVKYRISSQTARRSKRLVDVIAASVALVLSPLLILFVKNPSGFFSNIIKVYAGAKTWVSYQQSNNDDTLPPIKPGPLPPWGRPSSFTDQETKQNVNFYYARDYTVWKDVSLILQNIKHLGN